MFALSLNLKVRIYGTRKMTFIIPLFLVVPQFNVLIDICSNCLDNNNHNNIAPVWLRVEHTDEG